MKVQYVFLLLFTTILPALGQQPMRAPIASNYPPLTTDIVHHMQLQAVVHIRCSAVLASMMKAERRNGDNPTTQSLIEYAHGYCDDEEATMANQDKDPHTLTAMVELTEQLDRAAGDAK